jgi:hypothetical protein
LDGLPLRLPPPLLLLLLLLLLLAGGVAGCCICLHGALRRSLHLPHLAYRVSAAAGQLAASHAHHP